MGLLESLSISNTVQGTGLLHFLQVHMNFYLTLYLGEHKRLLN